MMNENYEVTMEEENKTYTGEVEPTENESEVGISGGAIALIAGGAMIVGGLVTAGIRELKKRKAESTKEEKPKKQKMKKVKVPADVDMDELLAMYYAEPEGFEEDTEEE